MTRRLVIVESPAKARTLQRYLGEGWIVRATAGHVKDLPEGRLAVDLTGSYQPEYQVLRGKGHVLQDLAREARLCDEVFLATDPDREGEAIAWHVAEELGLEGRARRARLHEIAPAALGRALEAAGPLDRARYDAQQARRVVDRIVGFSLAPLLGRVIQRGLSAGRVQSLALRLLVEREQQRRQANAVPRYRVVATLAAGRGAAFTAAADAADREGAEAWAAAVRTAQGAVDEVARRERVREPPPPFVTARLQQEAYDRLRFALKKTMRLAQQLYEGVDLGPAGPVSLLTYARTDSPRVSEGAAAGARTFLAGRFGADAVAEAPRHWSAPGAAQDAHEAVRPTSVELEPALVKPHLDRDAGRLYELVWRRFCAGQLQPARYVERHVALQAGGVRLEARGLELVEPGFLALWEGKTVPAFAGELGADDLGATARLPALEAGDLLEVREVSVEELPPALPPSFTEASLLGALEAHCIGRPSTWSQTVDTLLERGYVARDRGALVPTELGEAVVGLLLQAVPDLVDPGLTASLEAELDEVAAGQRDWVEVVRRFHEPFAARVEAARTRFGAPARKGHTELPCDRCGAPMALRWGRSGPFLSCSTYPTCRHTRDLAVPGQATSVVLGVAGRQEAAAVAPQVAPPTRGSCPRCGAALVERRGRSGPFLACSAYPACRTSVPLSTGVRCPACGEGEIAEKRSRQGRTFFGCNRYPACDHVMRERPVPQPCPTCGAAHLVQRFSRREGGILACAAEGCGHWMPLAEALAE